jgi:nicotinamidase-related amidase
MSSPNRLLIELLPRRFVPRLRRASATDRRAPEAVVMTKDEAPAGWCASRPGSRTP